MEIETLVRSIFRFIANLDPNVDPQTLSVQQILQELNNVDQNSYNAGFDRVTISYGDDPSMTPDQLAQLSLTCSQDHSLQGYSLVNKNNNPTICHIAICDTTFNTYYSLRYTADPPAAAAAAVPGLTCNGLGDRQSDYMSSAGTTFLHELMHCSR